MKYRFSGKENKWTTVMKVADIARERRGEEFRIAVEEAVEEMAAMGALATSIDESTGETLYRYDDTDPRARMIMTALASNEVTPIQ